MLKFSQVKNNPRKKFLGKKFPENIHTKQKLPRKKISKKEIKKNFKKKILFKRNILPKEKFLERKFCETKTFFKKRNCSIKIF